MKCSNCNNINISESSNICPLCGNILNPEKIKNQNSYPSYAECYLRQHRMTLSRVWMFLSLCVIIISITVNAFTYSQNSVMWSVIVSAVVLYAWISLENTIKSRMHIGGKVLIQFICVSALVVIIDFCVGFNKWSINYVIPFLSIGTTLLLTILAGVKKSRWYEYTAYLVAAFLESLIPFALCLTPITSVIWTGVAAFVYSLLTIIALIVFSDKKFKLEIRKRLHF